MNSEGELIGWEPIYGVPCPSLEIWLKVDACKLCNNCVRITEIGVVCRKAKGE